MDIVQPLAKHILDPFLAAREGSSHIAFLRLFEKSQYFSAQEIKQRQLDLLFKLINHAYQNCPFYTRRFDEAGLHPDKFSGFEDLEKVPRLTKKDIQNYTETMKALNYEPEQLVKNQTGGSSGAPLTFFLNQERLYSRKAATMRHDRWAGWDIGHKMAVLWGHHRDFSNDQGVRASLREKFYSRRIFLDTSDITPDRLALFTRELLRFRPRVYLAYANAMFLFARYLKEKGIKDYHRPAGIITSAELLTDVQRSLIEEVFGCPVYNRYGSRETSVIASECAEHIGMHICSEALYLEFRRQDRPCRAGEIGNILVTDLMNYGMPLIRYQIEDTGSPLDSSCACGRGLPLMKMEGGRVTDFLVTPEGKVISGAAMTIYFIATIPGIAQAQLVQKELDFLLLRIVRGGTFDNDTEALLKEAVVKFFGARMKYQLEFVDNIPPEPSGKLRFSICEIDPMAYLT